MTRQFAKKRGFLTVAQNGTTDYVRMAYALALSLKVSQDNVSDLSIMVTPGTKIPDKYRAVFDEIIDIPWLDEANSSDWKLENEWKVYHVTPYEETIKLDADMLFPTDISQWWDIMAANDLTFATKAKTFRGEAVTSDYYRKTFTANGLPDVYSALMYFRYSDRAEEFFKMAEVIFHNWEHFFFKFLDETRPTFVSTDVVYALALRCLDIEDEVTVPNPVPAFVHMKSGVQNFGGITVGENWLRKIATTLTDDLDLQIGTHRQFLPVHYHRKEFLTDQMIHTYERILGL
jgi:hypothetical protein